MRKKLVLPFVLLFVFVSLKSPAQRKIVILGSSTAAGNGATAGNSWASKLQAAHRINNSDGLDTVVVNYAYPGFVTYQTMPTDFVLPPNRTSWPQDPLRNVTKALETPLPDIVIINLPSNDVNLWPAYDKKETMDNFRLMFQRITSVGVKCFITTTQPRNDMTSDKRLMLRELRDSVLNNFGIYAINFWDDIVANDGSNNMKPEVNSGDNIHINNLGHNLVYLRVMAKDMFNIINIPLPLSLHYFNVQLQGGNALVKWKTTGEEPNTSYEIQKKINATEFNSVSARTANANGLDASYTWTDHHVSPGASYYRLKITEPGKVSYSQVVSLMNKGKKLSITRLYFDPNQLHIDINTEISQKVVLTIADIGGRLVYKNQVNLNLSNTQLTIPVAEFSTGEYIIKVLAADGNQDAQKFMKLK
jgi:lysophospholipase L1-like esterase